jgi:hypothetical protein
MQIRLREKLVNSSVKYFSLALRILLSPTRSAGEGCDDALATPSQTA